MRSTSFRVVLVILFLLTLAASADAATWTVGPGGPPTYDYATIQAAINALSTVSGDIIEIDPAGNPYSENVTVTNKSLTFQSSTSGTLVVVDGLGTGGNCFDLSATDGNSYTVVFNEIEIDGRSLATDGIHVSASSGNMAIEVYNCDIHDNNDDGIELSGVNGSIIGDGINGGNYIYDNGWFGIWLTEDGLDTSDYNFIGYNEIYGNFDGIGLWDAGVSNTVSYNYIYDNDLWGIYAYNGTDLLIEGNEIEGNGIFDGIYFVYITDSFIVGNDIHDNGWVGAIDGCGIYLQDSDNNLIFANECYDNYFAGILFTGFSDSSDSNQFVGNTTAAWNWEGIYSDWAGQYNVISGNWSFDNEMCCLHLKSGSDLTIGSSARGLSISDIEERIERRRSASRVRGGRKSEISIPKDDSSKMSEKSKTISKGDKKKDDKPRKSKEDKAPRRERKLPHEDITRSRTKKSRAELELDIKGIKEKYAPKQAAGANILFMSAWGWGIRLIDIHNTTIYNNYTIENYEDGIYLEASDNIPIEGNFIVENGYSGVSGGIYLDPTSTNITANENVICGNIAYGVNNTTGVLLDAEGNWWGDNSGPYHPTTNPGGVGDAVSDNVDYDPWLQMSLTANPTSVGAGGTSTITATMTGGIYKAPDWTPIDFSTNLGTIDPATAYTVGGSATSLLSSTIAGTATVSAVTPCPMDTAVTTDVVFLPTEIVFITPIRLVYVGLPSNVITIQLQDINGNPVSVAVDTTINLTSLNLIGQFSLTHTPFVPITSVVIPAGSNSVTFHFKGFELGTATMLAAEAPDYGWTDGTQLIHVILPEPPAPPPIADISSPTDMQIVKGEVDVIGTAFSEIFDNYILEYGEGEDPSSWTLINTSTQAVTDDLLGNWDTSSLPDGTYTVRITAKDTEGRTATDKVTVIVDNTPPQMSDLAVEDKFIETECDRAEWKITAKVTDQTSGIDRESLKITISSEGMNDIVVDWTKIGYDENTGEISYTLKGNLKSGEYTVKIEVKDKVSNKTEMTTTFTVEAILGLHNVMNAPNPMTNRTVFTFSLCMEAEVRIEIYTTAGELVRVLDEIAGEMGYNEVAWDGLDEDGEEVADGIYIYRIRATGDGKTIEEIKTLAVIR